MINTVVLTGRPTTELELANTKSGIKAVQFNLAVGRSFKNNEGQYETDFFTIVAFNQTAEYLTKYAKKGKLIGIEGRLQQRQYVNKEGVNIYVVEVIANQITILSPKETDTNINIPYVNNDLPF